MNDINFTEKEQMYLDCDTPMISAGTAARKLTSGILIGLATTVFAPANQKGERRIISTVHLMRDTKYKKAVLRKRDNTPKKHDAKLLMKLNKKDFVLEEKTFDPDEYARKLYEEYMEKHNASPKGKDNDR